MSTGETLGSGRKALVASASRVSMPTQDAVILPALPRGVVASALRRHDALAKPTVRKVAARPYRWDAAPLLLRG